MKIILLRHGQYKRNPSETLTTLGRKQARKAGKRLQEYKIDTIHSSTMPRAKQTAKIIKQQLSHKKKVTESNSLCECVPGFPKSERKAAGFSDVKMLLRGQKQADKAFDKYFRKKTKKTILLVCHGNIIRYLVCKAIGVDTLAWVNMDIHQCGFSIIEYSSQTKRLELICHNDTGHIPLHQRTFI